MIHKNVGLSSNTIRWRMIDGQGSHNRTEAVFCTTLWGASDGVLGGLEDDAVDQTCDASDYDSTKVKEISTCSF